MSLWNHSHSNHHIQVFSLCWNPKEIGYNTREGMSPQKDGWTCWQEWEEAGKKQQLSSSLSFFVACHQKMGPRCKVDFVTLPYSKETLVTLLWLSDSWDSWDNCPYRIRISQGIELPPMKQASNPIRNYVVTPVLGFHYNPHLFISHIL